MEDPGRDWWVVALGGATGAAGRLAVGLALPAEPIELAVVVVNLLGAVVLGMLVARPMTTRQALFWRTGVLGAFTTFSAMSAEAVQLGPPLGAVYLVGLVGAGWVAAAGGLRLGDILGEALRRRGRGRAT